MKSVGWLSDEAPLRASAAQLVPRDVPLTVIALVRSFQRTHASPIWVSIISLKGSIECLFYMDSMYYCWATPAIRSNDVMYTFENGSKPIALDPRRKWDTPERLES